jgi:hypothetical protein
MRNFLATLVLTVFLTASAFAQTPTHVYSFPARLHNYPLVATLSVFEDTKTWQVDFKDNSQGVEQVVPHPPSMSFGGTFVDANGERTFSTEYAHARIIFKKDGNKLTFEHASVHFEMDKVPVSPK